jgi:hypothetical protein
LFFFFSIQHHVTPGASLNVSGSFELVATNGVQRSLSWSTVPSDDIVVNDSYSPLENDDNEQRETASLEIRKPLDLLGNDLQIVVTPTNQKLDMKQIYSQITENVVPIFIYIIEQEILSDNDIEELRLFHIIVPNEPILFIRIDQNDDSSSNTDETDGTSCVQVFR